MEIELYNFSKRENSTKTPTEAGTVKTVRLKEKCCLTNPSFFLTGSEEYNYCKAWGRYYFIDGITWDINGAEYIHCTIDVLGTYKEQIKNTSAFVKYSTSNYDVLVHDERISQREARSRLLTPRDSLFVDNHINGTYIVSTVSMDNGLSIWAMDYTQFSFLIQALCQAGQNVWESLQALLGDAMGGVISARYVPIAPNYWDVPLQIVMIGDYIPDVEGQNVYGRFLGTEAKFEQERDFNIPWIYTDFRKNSNYTRLYFVLPFVGAVDVSPESVLGKDTIHMKMVGNASTGVVNYGIYITDDANREHLLATYSGECGRQIPVAASQVDSIGVFKSLIAEGEALGEVAAGAVSSATKAIKEGLSAWLSANKKDFTTIGGFGGGYGENIILDYKLVGTAVECRTTPSELTILYGRPCAKVLSIGTLSGYVQTEGFSIELDALKEERNMINTLMDSGVYLE